mmetsp:Transcript_29450/g.75954  ORF Transcript_29450/g.75954 Transcript_29450/m.75954 type:complete len:329 (+) Transcript_29450:172-1158(+)
MPKGPQGAEEGECMLVNPGQHGQYAVSHKRPGDIREIIPKRAWGADEDERLITILDRHGVGQWSQVARQLGTGRCGKQCRERWFNHLDPVISKGEWTAEEDRLIEEGVRLYGHKWCEIVKMLPPGRSDNAIKNRYNSNMRKRKRADERAALVAERSVENAERKALKAERALAKAREAAAKRARKEVKESARQANAVVQADGGTPWPWWAARENGCEDYKDQIPSPSRAQLVETKQGAAGKSVQQTQGRNPTVAPTMPKARLAPSSMRTNVHGTASRSLVEGAQAEEVPHQMTDFESEQDDDDVISVVVLEASVASNGSPLGTRLATAV